MIEGGTGSGRADRTVSSLGMWSLSEFWISVTAGAAEGPGKSVNAGSGPCETGGAGSKSGAGAARWAKPGRMGGPLLGRNPRESMACAKSENIAEAM